MPLNADIVGSQTDAISHQVDNRWLMAFAAAVGETTPTYFDTQAGAVHAHPLFPVCLEWPALLASRAISALDALTPDEAARGVHAAHDLHLLAPIQDGDTMSTSLQVVAVRSIRSGTAMTTRIDTTNLRTGKLSCRTWQLSVYRDVSLVGGDRAITAPPALPEAASSEPWREDEVAVSPTAAHTYTECARIFNPIHTDRAVALAAGLPDIILHGTATMAMACSAVVARHLGGEPERVIRVGGSFRSMVLMPSTLTVRSRAEGQTIMYEVVTPAGELAIASGFIGVR